MKSYHLLCGFVLLKEQPRRQFLVSRLNLEVVVLVALMLKECLSLLLLSLLGFEVTHFLLGLQTVSLTTIDIFLHLTGN